MSWAPVTHRYDCTRAGLYTSLTTTSLSFVLMIFNASFTVLAFSGVLWSISPILVKLRMSSAMGSSGFGKSPLSSIQ